MTTLATATMRDLGAKWVGAIRSAVLSGIVGDAAHQTAPGKHLGWADNRSKFGAGAWPLSHSAGDRNPPNKSAAAAIDITMNRADQNAVHNRLIALFNNRSTDPRAKYVTAFNGWNGSGVPMRYSLTNGATAQTDSSHEWHEHLEIPYDKVDDPAMVRAVMSVITGQTEEADVTPEQDAMLKDIASRVKYVDGRVGALYQNLPEITDKQFKNVGEDNKVAGALAKLEAKPTGTAVVDPAVIKAAIAEALADPDTVAALVKAVGDDMSARLQG